MRLGARAATRAGVLLVLLLLAGWLTAGGATAARGPHFSVRAVSLAPSTVTQGGSAGVTGTLVNRARRAVSLEIEAVLSGSGQSIAKQQIEIGPRHKVPFALDAAIPAGVAPGAYGVTVCATRADGKSRCAGANRTLLVEAQGRAPTPMPQADADADGLPDVYDVCPGQPGVASSGGCPPPPPDGDGDGVPDSEDVCPAVPGVPLYDGCPPPPTYVSGARTLGDPLFPEVGNGGYDVEHYQVELNYTNATNEFLPGTRTIITAQTTQNLSDFSLDLQGLTVMGVKVNGVDAADVTRMVPPQCSPADPPNAGCPASKLLITPATSLPADQMFTVEVSYVGSPVRHRDADGTDEGWLDTPNGDGSFVVNEPVGAMTWLPCNNHPLDKATYDFELTVPTGKTALGNGEETAPPTDNGDGTTTWHWQEDDPMATYLTTASVGNFDLTHGEDSFGLEFYNAVESTATAPEKLQVQTSTDREGAIVDYMSDLYGPYPFDSIGVVADDAGNVGYVLEVQTKIHFPSPLVTADTLAHEITHQWFGDSVSLTTWKDIWLNEGWATWSQWNWSSVEDNNPAESPTAQFTANYTPGAKWSTPPADPTAAGLFSTFPVYTRPAMMLQALREIIGDSRFFNLARDWQSTHGGANANTAQFIALAKQHSGFSGANLAKLDSFFQEWLFGTTMPTITGSNFF